MLGGTSIVRSDKAGLPWGMLDEDGGREGGMDWLKDIDMRQWWVAVVAAGVALATASAAAHLVPALFVGLGAVAFGVGEWINHPLLERIVPGYKITGYPRAPKVSGVFLDLVGAVLFAFGIYRLAAA